MKKESEKKALVALLFLNCMAALEVQSNFPQATTSKCEELVVAYARWSLTRALLHKVFYEEKCGQTYFLERIICMQFLCFSIVKSVLFLKVLLIL